MALALMGHNVDPTRALGGIAQSCWQCLRAHRGAAVAYAPLDHVSTLGHLRLGARRSGNLIIGLCARVLHEQAMGEASSSGVSTSCV